MLAILAILVVALFILNVLLLGQLISKFCFELLFSHFDLLRVHLNHLHDLIDFHFIFLLLSLKQLDLHLLAFQRFFHDMLWLLLKYGIPHFFVQHRVAI